MRMRNLSLESLETREFKTVDTGLDLTVETETSTAAYIKFDGVAGESSAADPTSDGADLTASEDPDEGISRNMIFALGPP